MPPEMTGCTQEYEVVDIPSDMIPTLLGYYMVDITTELTNKDATLATGILVSRVDYLFTQRIKFSDRTFSS